MGCLHADSGNSSFSPDQVRALTESPEILQRIFEFAPDAILLVDGDGRIVMTNAQGVNMFGYTREELVGQLVEILVPSRLGDRHVGYRSGYLSSPRMRPMGAGLDLFGVRKNGTEFPVDIMLSPLSAEGVTLVLGVIRDATERKEIEAQADAVREMYIKEVHHRVKNNLQVISSLLYLQTTHTRDSNALHILRESQSRVKSIALIHEKLYRSADAGLIDFAEYARDLVSDLFRTYGVQQDHIRVELDIDNVRLDVDTAVPCGLIINELFANTLKYAFPDGRDGVVGIELRSPSPKWFTLTMRDNGVGLPPGFENGTGNSLGLKLVKDLTRQLEGKMSIESNGGTTFRIEFRQLHYKERS